MEKIDSRENLIRLINQYQNLVFSLCLKLTGDYFTAEDITQDTFIAVYKHWDSFDGTNEKAWVCRIATNKCIDYKKAAARNEIALEDEMSANIPDYYDPLQEVMNKSIMEDFRKSIDSLNEPYRSVAFEHFIEGKTARVISEESDTNIKSVQTKILRAKTMLKELIRKEVLST